MRLWIPLAALLALAGCSSPRPRFLPMAEQFAYDSLAMAPSSATSNGYHLHQGIALDAQLDDVSPAAFERQRRFYSDWKTRLQQGIRPSDLEPEDQADYQMLLDQTELALLELDSIQSWRHNPTVYVETLGNALYSPSILEYAPLDQRYRYILARLHQVPAFLAQARTNLLDSPEIWNTVAQEENEGNIRLIDETLRREVPGALRAEFDRAAGPALAALRDFQQFLKQDLSSRRSDWRLGRERYARKFRYALGTDQTPERILADAEQQLDSMRNQMAELAKKIPGVSASGDRNSIIRAALDKVITQHATREGYFNQAKTDLAETTEFVRSHGVVPLFETSNLQVIETPEFMRGIYSVGGFSPAPPLEPKLGAFYWVTPIPAAWPADRVESKLREYNNYGMQILTIHEAMPGHYVQAEYAARVEPKARRIFRALFGNGPYIEGWAVYATEMMLDQGYQNTPEMRLVFLKDMLRVVTNTILDVRLQTMGMTDQQALDLMQQEAFQQKDAAEGKLQRAKLSSCQLPTYFVGWRDWGRLLRTDQEVHGGDFRLREFHRKALAEGPVPLPVLSRLLTGSDLH